MRSPCSHSLRQSFELAGVRSDTVNFTWILPHYGKPQPHTFYLRSHF